MAYMKRTFTLAATYEQSEQHDLEVTVAQASALDHHRHLKTTFAEVIRANWQAIYKALQSFKRPGYPHSSIWPDDERMASLLDVEGGDCQGFTATLDGPRFTHEIESAGRHVRSR